MAQYKEHKFYKNIIEAKALITAALHEKENGVIYWIIENKKTKEIVGYVKLPTETIKNKKREMAFYFLEGWREDGTPEEVLSAVIYYIFTEEEYETIVTKFYGRNKQSIELVHKVLSNVGMTREGILRNRLINDKGEKIDRYIYSILKEEWKVNKDIKTE